MTPQGKNHHRFKCLLYDKQNEILYDKQNETPYFKNAGLKHNINKIDKYINKRQIKTIPYDCLLHLKGVDCDFQFET